MKRSFLVAFAVAVLLVASAMARGLLSAVDSNIGAAISSFPQAGRPIMVADAKNVSGSTSIATLAVDITKMGQGITRQTRPVNERMLN